MTDFDRFDNDAYDAEWARPFSLVGAMLKSQGALYRDLGSGRWIGRTIVNLALATALLAIPYGAIMGMSASAGQSLYAALKFPMILLGSALLCLPTFYVFNALLGSRVTFAQAAASVFFLTAGASVILIAFAPIAWLFTASTTEDGWRFLALLHATFALTAAYFGVRFLRVGQQYLSARLGDVTVFNLKLLGAWFALLIVVGFQLAYTMRPIMSDGPFLTGERGSFMTYVGEMLGD